MATRSLAYVLAYYNSAKSDCHNSEGESHDTQASCYRQHTVFHGMASSRHSENAHTNNSYPIKALLVWAFSLRRRLLHDKNIRENRSRCHALVLEYISQAHNRLI